MARYHYDSQGNYKGESLDDGEVVARWIGNAAFWVGVPVLLLVWVWKTVSGYATLPPPYKWFAAYYYYALAVPADAAIAVSDWFIGATRWRNLNRVLTFTSFFVVWALPYLSAALILRRLPGMVTLISLFGPLAASIIWFAVSSVTGWLFAS